MLDFVETGVGQRLRRRPPRATRASTSASVVGRLAARRRGASSASNSAVTRARCASSAVAQRRPSRHSRVPRAMRVAIGSSLAATHASAHRAASAGGFRGGAGSDRRRPARRPPPRATWPAVDQRLQRRQQAAFAQRRLAAAADQLQGLHQEFDLADAARAALDVVGEFLARDFGGDRRLHLAQAVERAVVEVAAIDERPQRLEEALARGDVARHRPRLLPGVALPVAAFALEVLLHRRERPAPRGRHCRTDAGAGRRDGRSRRR